MRESWSDAGFSALPSNSTRPLTLTPVRNSTFTPVTSASPTAIASDPQSVGSVGIAGNSGFGVLDPVIIMLEPTAIAVGAAEGMRGLGT